LMVDRLLLAKSFAIELKEEAAFLEGFARF
jgi:hypothetical protein